MLDRLLTTGLTWLKSSVARKRSTLRQIDSAFPAVRRIALPFAGDVKIAREAAIGAGGDGHVVDLL